MNASSYLLVRWVFLRLLGVVYLIAFASLWLQLSGLVGRHGILPAVETMASWRQLVPAGLGRFLRAPTLCWISTSGGFLAGMCALGTILAVLVIANVAPAPALALLWLLYLSLSVVGGPFLSFQWDALLLETGLLALFLAPLQLLPWRSGVAPPSLVILWLLRILLFRLMFGSGLVKLLSGDASWRNLTALTYHYFTQPLPTPLGWWAAQLPPWFQMASCAAMFAIELGAPLLIFAPRPFRLFALAALVTLQLLIAATGNYGFFNLLTVTLCVVLLDDRVLGALMPHALAERLARAAPTAFAWPQAVIVPATVLLAAAVIPTFGRYLPSVRWPWPLPQIARFAAPFRSTNAYGLFAVMTKERPEIVVEGSEDGESWRAYEFRYKPGDVRRPPPWVAPYQPRLDWQMWFAALGDARSSPWFTAFVARLLEGSRPVLRLLATNPFPAGPPRHVRARLYDYRFTTIEERSATGAWWKREPLGEYLPAVSLRRQEAGE